LALIEDIFGWQGFHFPLIKLIFQVFFISNEPLFLGSAAMSRATAAAANSCAADCTRVPRVGLQTAFATAFARKQVPKVSHISIKQEKQARTTPTPTRLRNFCVICAKKIKLARKKSARKIFEF
jgi:hypothetical protein